MSRKWAIDDNPERMAWIKAMRGEPERPPVVVVGEGASIHPTVEFGSDGFTAERGGDRKFVRCPNYGDVVIGDGVRIGEFSVVRRSTLPGTATIVGDGTVILSSVVVGHNCKIGRNNFIGNHVQLCGSVEIGDNCWISPHVAVHQHVKIGDGATIGLGAVVLDDVPPGETVAGVPAVSSRFHGNEVHSDFRHGRNLKIGKYNCIYDGVIVGNDCTIRNHVELRRGTVVGDGCYLDSGVKSSGDCEIGDDVVVRYDSIIAKNVVIEDGVYISPQVMFVNVAFTKKTKRKTVVRAGAKIGTNATINDGVEIGRNVVIGAKAFVNRDCVEPGTYVGVPARRMK